MNKKAVVSGGGTGIGRATALALAREGAQVIIIGHERHSLLEVSSCMPEQIHPFVCDVRNAGQWTSLMQSHPDVDVLVNNAGVSVQTDVASENDSSWDAALSVNFRGALNGCRIVAPFMKMRGGRIVNITSIHGTLCEYGSSAYGVSKAALNQLTRSLAIELASWNILVNAVAPGFVDTPMSCVTGTNELKSGHFIANFIANGRIPLKRAANPEEICRPILFLASDENTYITGHILTADGGLTLTL